MVLSHGYLGETHHGTTNLPHHTTQGAITSIHSLLFFFYLVQGANMRKVGLWLVQRAAAPQFGVCFISFVETLRCTWVKKNKGVEDDLWIMDYG